LLLLLLEGISDDDTDLERGSYPDDTLSTDLLKGKSVCKDSLRKADWVSGDSERGAKGEDKGLGSPVTDQHDASSMVTAGRRCPIPRTV
jgi:hypothetical protein